MRWVVLVLGAGLIASTLWVGGEVHRRNCVEQHRYDCSVLPWKSGRQPAVALPAGVSQEELDQLLKEQQGR